MNPHPNATAGIGGAGIGTLAVWLLNKYTSAGLDGEAGAAVSGIFVGLVLLVGRGGLVGLWQALLHGTKGSVSPQIVRVPADKIDKVILREPAKGGK